MCSEVGLFHLEERDEALFSFLQFAPHKNDSFLHLIPDRLRVLIRDDVCDRGFKWSRSGLRTKTTKIGTLNI